MRLQPHFLSMFLLMVVSCCPVAAGQQSSTLNLRRGIIASDPGVPAVHVTVDRRRVPLGTLVTFTLTPASVVSSSQYTVTLRFGDGKQQSVRATQVPHLYQAVGTYIYSVQVKSNLRPPQVSLIATPVRVSPGRQVSFSAQTSWSYPNLRYRFSFGDGRTSGWQDSPRANYAYQNDGRYSAYVDIGDGTAQLGGSTRKEIDVVSQILPFNVWLTANPTTVRARQPVTFVARALPVNDTTKYRFFFGDSQSTGWQASSQARHVYANSGSYRARVDARQLDSGRTANATSAPTVVAVGRTPPPTPTPGPTPRPSPQPTPASSPTPVGSPSPNNNSSPSPSPTSSSSPVGSTSPSPVASGSPTPTGTKENGGSSSSSGGDSRWLGSSEDWWKYLLILALILFLIYQLSGLLFVARPTFAPFSDPGASVVSDSERGLPIDFQLVLNPNVSTAAYAVETTEPSLVKNADRLQERQILEI